MKEENLEFNILEKELGSVLKPINPEENYVSYLRNKLMNETGISIEKTNYFQFVIIFGIFFLSGLMVICLLRYLRNHKLD